MQPTRCHLESPLVGGPRWASDCSLRKAAFPSRIRISNSLPIPPFCPRTPASFSIGLAIVSNEALGWDLLDFPNIGERSPVTSSGACGKFSATGRHPLPAEWRILHSFCLSSFPRLCLRDSFFGEKSKMKDQIACIRK